MTDDDSDSLDDAREIVASIYESGLLGWPLWLYDSNDDYLGTSAVPAQPDAGDEVKLHGDTYRIIEVESQTTPEGRTERFEAEVTPVGITVTESDGTEGIAYFLCSECGQPVVEYGKDDEPHYFDRRECGCPGGSPKHGWRMLQDSEVEHPGE